MDEGGGGRLAERWALRADRRMPGMQSYSTPDMPRSYWRGAWGRASGNTCSSLLDIPSRACLGARKSTERYEMHNENFHRKEAYEYCLYQFYPSK